MGGAGQAGQGRMLWLGLGTRVDLTTVEGEGVQLVLNARHPCAASRCCCRFLGNAWNNKQAHRGSCFKQTSHECRRCTKLVFGGLRSLRRLQNTLLHMDVCPKEFVSTPSPQPSFFMFPRVAPFESMSLLPVPQTRTRDPAVDAVLPMHEPTLGSTSCDSCLARCASAGGSNNFRTKYIP